MTPEPPIIPPDRLVAQLSSTGRAVLDAAGVARLSGVAPAALEALANAWGDLPPDAHLRDGGRYRRRRHGSFVLEGGQLRQTAHRAHWQPVEYNALHGGLERWFAPLQPATVAQAAWAPLIGALADACSALKGAQPWFVEAHQFRIDTTDGIGRPTPEGAHRDGVDYVVVALIGRQGVKGGETRVFDACSPNGIRFTMAEPWTLLMLDDERMVHETTPIQPVDAGGGWRDTLVLTFRAHAFQGPSQPASPRPETTSASGRVRRAVRRTR